MVQWTCDWLLETGDGGDENIRGQCSSGMLNTDIVHIHVYTVACGASYTVHVQ